MSAPTCTWRTKRELYWKVSLPIYNYALCTITSRTVCKSRRVGPRVSGAYKVSHVLSIAVLTFGFSFYGAREPERHGRFTRSQREIGKGK